MIFSICIFNLKTYFPIDISCHFRTFLKNLKTTTCKCVLKMFLLWKNSPYVYHFSKTSGKKHKITIYDWSQKNHVFCEKHRTCIYWKNNKVSFHVLNCPEMKYFQPWIKQKKHKSKNLPLCFQTKKMYDFWSFPQYGREPPPPPPRLVTNFSKKSKSQKNKSQWGGPKKDSKKWDSDEEWTEQVNLKKVMTSKYRWNEKKNSTFEGLKSCWSPSREI